MNRRYQSGRMVATKTNKAKPQKAQKTRPMSARPRKEPDTSTYPGRIAARLGELLERRGWTISEAADQITAAGEPISEAALGYYLRGEREIPWRYVPVIAGLFGYKQAHGWLPEA